jgi:predicted nucleotidyltransferase
MQQVVAGGEIVHESAACERRPPQARRLLGEAGLAGCLDTTLEAPVDGAKSSLTPGATRPYSGPMPPAAPEDLAARLRDLAAVAPDVELVVLFGSVATGRARTRSDVDIAVRCAGPADLDELYRVLASRIGTYRLDLVDLRRASPLLMMEVARRGRVLFERHPGVFRQFQALASRRYCDTVKLRRAQRRAIQAFLARGFPA